MTELKSARSRPQRSDGEQSRERLMRAALQLFALQGFAKTSTREIAEAAGANLAAIKYYFGDKAGLYRTVFSESVGDPTAEIARFKGDVPTLDQVLRGLYTGFIAPLRAEMGPCGPEAHGFAPASDRTATILPFPQAHRVSS